MTGSKVSIRSVVISGGTGFVGAATARALAERHPECAITIVDLHPPGPTHAVPGSATFIQADITNADETAKILQHTRPDVVIHTAGIVPDLAERFARRLQNHVWRVNVEGTKNMLEAAKKSGSIAFIYTSSCCAVTDGLGMPYPNVDENWPTSRTSLIYGESKVWSPECFLRCYSSCKFSELLTMFPVGQLLGSR